MRLSSESDEEGERNLVWAEVALYRIVRMKKVLDTTASGKSWKEDVYG